MGNILHDYCEGDECWYNIAEGRREGIRKGRSEGRREGKTEAIRSLMESMSMTAEQAMKALKIPAGEFGKYMTLL